VTAPANLDSDEAIARQAQAGLLSGFEELVRRYEIRIHRFVAGRCRDGRDAQEVTQDVFVAAYRGLPRFDARRSFATWLFTIARRKCIDHFRARRPDAEDLPPERADTNDPVVLLVQRESESDVWRLARSVLTEMQFDALWLRYAEDMVVADVARVMKRTRTHVKVLLFRARMRLEAELEKQSNQQNLRPATGRRRDPIRVVASKPALRPATQEMP
jgi:RNA polymerase sigma-70 factor (ECF subfamily)